jgi:RNA polymerase sigma-70 factor (ECF subfamily)
MEQMRERFRFQPATKEKIPSASDEEWFAMPADSSFAAVIARLRAGDDAAAQHIFDRFANRLIGLARSYLDSKVRQKVDPEDVMLSACKSFFVRFTQERFKLTNWDNLWSLLTVLTVRKCRRWNAHYHTDKRDVNIEAAPLPDSDSEPDWQALAADPTPEEAVMLTDLVEGLLRELPPENGPILSLALQGHSAAEISKQLNRPERTVSRVLKKVRDRLEQFQAEEAGEA